MAASISGSCASHGEKSGGLASMHSASGRSSIFDPPHSTMDLELVISELLVTVRALKAENVSLKAQNRELTAKKNKLIKLMAQVELLKAEIETLNQNLVEVTKSEQKSVQKCKELMENNKELATALNKRPAPPPNGPSAAKWRERCEKLQEKYRTLQLCYKRLKTELQELQEAYRGFVFVDFSSMKVDI
ncbi:hypothetical protein C8J57DRAFT_1265284 [Mycena rebaudengoi]|nr:hypothetical protein C8J57DRAFT_1265284 [Mycena rebaudengoi]